MAGEVDETDFIAGFQPAQIPEVGIEVVACYDQAAVVGRAFVASGGNLQGRIAPIGDDREG